MDGTQPEKRKGGRVLYTWRYKGRPYSVIKDVAAQLCDVLVEIHMDFPKALLLPIQGLPLSEYKDIIIFVGRHIFRVGWLKSVRKTLLVHYFHNMAKYNVLFVLGGPGAGKGTQCEKIEKEYDYLHLSAGDLLRAERNNIESKVGEEIETHIKNGTIVPVEITCNLLKTAMEKSGKQTFLIDGFPRNKDNLEGWHRVMDSSSEVKMVLFFNCSEKTCVERCLARGATSGRADDNKESLTKRIQTYSQSTMPIIEHYRKLKLVQEIQCENSAEEVFDDVKKALKSLQS